jgi:hypothetical protein
MKKLKITPQLLNKLKKWWRIYRCIQDDYWQQVVETENKMRQDAGIEDLEFFHPEGDLAVGIGNDSRTMRLIQQEKLEK